MVAGDLIWEIAAVSEQDDAGFVCRHEADIGGCVVKSARLVNKVHVVQMNVFPGHRLSELLGHVK